MSTIHQLVIQGCREGFDGRLCDEIVAAAEHLTTIRMAAKHLLVEAECVGTTQGHRELLIRVGRLRNALREHDISPEELTQHLGPDGE